MRNQQRHKLGREESGEVSMRFKNKQARYRTSLKPEKL